MRYGAAANARVEAVPVGTPIDLGKLIRIPVPFTRVRYELEVRGTPTLAQLLEELLPAAASGNRNQALRRPS